MKYEVPVINISKFSIENIVTQSAYSAAKSALESEQAWTSASNKAVVKVNMDDWTAAN